MNPIKPTKSKIIMGGVVLLLSVVLAILAIVNQDEIVKFITPAQVKEQHLPTPVDTVPDGYTAIRTPQDLDNIRNNLAGNYILMNDIDMSEYTGFTSIGTEVDPFSGTLDGNCYVISGFTTEIFGLIDGGTVTKLGLKNFDIPSGATTGSLARFIINGTNINQVYAIGKIGGSTSSSGYSGGLVGTIPFLNKYFNETVDTSVIQDVYTDVEIGDSMRFNRRNNRIRRKRISDN